MDSAEGINKLRANSAFKLSEEQNKGFQPVISIPIVSPPPVFPQFTVNQ